jgi:hypothetical protein
MEPVMMQTRTLGKAIAAVQDAAKTDSLLRSARTRFITALPDRAPPRARWSWLAVALAATAGVAFVVARPRPLTFEVLGASSRAGRGDVGAWIAAPGNEARAVRFSEGTEVELAPGSRARVVDIDGEGARVILERGVAHARVVHTGHARWHVEAGPFDVRVTGTAFDATWDPSNEVVRVEVREGAVAISGCAMSAPRAVRAGESFHASCRDGRVDAFAPAEPRTLPAPIVVSHRPEEPPRLDVVPTPAIPARRIAPTPPASSPPTPTAPEPRDAAVSPPVTTWRDLATAGQYERALEAADFDLLCNTAPAPELLALADTARFAGRSDRAGQALQRVRARFGGTPEAATAAFQLGRLSFDHERRFADAAKWFEVYLAEQPRGPLGREAAGRLVEALHAAGSRAKARDAALRYLAAYPSGPHAELARTLAAP